VALIIDVLRELGMTKAEMFFSSEILSDEDHNDDNQE